MPEYKQALVKQLSRNLGTDLNNMGVEELFALLVKEPLSTIADPGRNMLIVIDGLDESEYQERNDLLDVIANHFCKLPCWIRFLCTTRPERNIAESLKQLKPFQLEPNEVENMQDIKLFLEKSTQHLISEGNKAAIVEKLVEKSEGLMLYAYFLVSFLKENMSTLDQGDLDGNLPLAISSVYYSYFKRLENELVKEFSVKEEHFLSLLCAVTASREPLPIDFVSKVLVPCANSPIARRKVLKAIGSVSSLLPIRDGRLHVIHKSVNDWLTDISCYGEHDFTVDEKEGHRILASLCSNELYDLKQKGVRDIQFSSNEKYALHHGARHMLLLDDNMRSRSLEECVQTYVTDLELLYAKLCISDSLAAEDILWLQSHEMSQSLSEDSKDLLSTLTILQRKYFNTITNHPRVFFQTVLNEGGTVLSSVASNLLQKKYPEIPYMEFMHKQVQQGAVLARFQCSSAVACLDVSPQLDYMVCECKDGTIRLWSLHTGKLEWTRPVMVKKLNNGWGVFCYRASSSHVLSVYRSVVFHPTADCVLPGGLSHAYTFDGELKPLFSESSCSFTVCSISGDKTTILTDCPDDAKCVIMWSLKDGSEISRTRRNDDVLSFAWSRDGKLLAISHCSGSICIVDAMDGFRTLAETVIPGVCGMIKFSPDCRSLFCIHEKGFVHLRKIFRLNINMAKLPSCTLYDCECYVPWEFESQSEAGFLLGDPILSLDYAFHFVLDKQTLLRGSCNRRFIDMFNINELQKTDREATLTGISDIVFSLSGETVYAVSDAAGPTVRTWDVSSLNLIRQKSRRTNNGNHLVAVKEGVLLTTASGSLELWNFELAKCVRSWTNEFGITKMIHISEERVWYEVKNKVTILDTTSGEIVTTFRIRSWTNEFGITKMIHISEERVACEAKNKVTILDTTSGEIVTTFRLRGNECLVTCNSKCQLLTCDIFSLKLSDGKITLWKEMFPSMYNPSGMFSLSEQFVVIWAPRLDGVYVLDALSGKTLHVLQDIYKTNAFRIPYLINCKFVSDEECVISSGTNSGGYCLQLFNVRSGDLLSVIDLDRQVNCLAACPRKRLLAIGQSDSEHGINLIQVRLPQDKDSRESKRLAL